MAGHAIGVGQVVALVEELGTETGSQLVQSAFEGLHID